MSWEKVGQKGGDSLPIVKIGDKPTRLRLIAGPGKFEEPQDRWQHWAEGEAAKIIKQPIGCIGARAGCIFHQEPLKFRTSKQFLMNAVVYEIDAKGSVTGKSIKVLSGNQIFEQMKNQCAMVAADPTAIDWLIGKTGTGKNTTYTVSMVPGNPLDGATVDLSQFEDAGDFASAENPKLVDYDKFDGYRKRTPQDQEAWYEEQMSVSEEAPAENNGTAATTAAPAAAATTTPAAAQPPVKMPPLGGAKPAAPAAAAPPPPPAAVAPPPPAPAGPTPEQISAAKLIINEWNAGSADNIEHLQYVVVTDGFTPEQKAAAQLLLDNPSGTAPAPAATTGGDVTALRTELGEIIKSSAALKGFASMKKFFSLAGPDKKALANLDASDLQMLLGIARQGDAAITAALNQAA